jgi:hypothetical protein
MQVNSAKPFAVSAVFTYRRPVRFRSLKASCTFVRTVLAVMGLALPLRAGPVKPERVVPAATPDQHALTVVNHLGESDEQAALRNGTSPARGRTLDPFGVAIRGSFKALPPVERPSATPAKPSPALPENNPAMAAKPVQAPTPNNQPTLEKAVAQLTIGGLNVTRREILIGARQVREGDLLELELNGQRFVAWVQKIDANGVQFCDTELRPLAPKPFHSGPRPLPASRSMADVRSLLDRNAP